MKVTQEKLPDSQLGLEIEISPEVSKTVYEKTIQRFMKTLNVPGFRRGKLPRQVLIQRFGMSRIKAAVIEELIDDTLPKAIEQEEIDALGNYKLRSSMEELIQQFQPGSVFTYSASVDIPPELQLAPYTNLTVKSERVDYNPEDVDKLIESYRERRATLVPIEDRPAALGDVAIIDFRSKPVEAPSDEQEAIAEADGTTELETEANPDIDPKEQASIEISTLASNAVDAEAGIILDDDDDYDEWRQDFQLDLNLEEFPIDGLIENIVGMQLDETKEFQARYSDDYSVPELAGMEVKFKVVLKELKERELPELDDDFAQDVSEYETIAELREYLETQHKESAEKETKLGKQDALMTEILSKTTVEFPETLIDKEVTNVLTQTLVRLSNQGLDIKSMMTPDLVSSLRERARPEAISSLKTDYTIAEIAKQESIEVDIDEVQAKMNEFLEENRRDDIDLEKLREVMTSEVQMEKVFEFLDANNTVELLPPGTLSENEESEDGDEDNSAEATESSEVDASNVSIDVTAEDVDADTEASPEDSAEDVDVDEDSAEDEDVEDSADDEDVEDSADDEEADKE